MPFTLFLADAIADASGLAAAPGAVLLDPAGVVIDAGPVDRVYRHPDTRSATVIEQPGHILLPAIINAHAHLDLTHVGRRPYDPAGGFMAWIGMVIENRASTPEDIQASVSLGIQRSIAGGVAAVGDIAGVVRGAPSHAARETLLSSPLAGVSFLEFLAIGTTETDRLASLESSLQGMASGNPSEGLSPHAPNTVGTAGFATAARVASERGWPLTTHLAETPEERAFVAHAEGPQRELLEKLGLWESHLAAQVGLGKHPIDHVLDSMGPLPKVTSLVHVNDCPDEQLDRLANTAASVVYCPRASADFLRHEDFGPHRYQEMLARGINVALGTDSAINLETERISPLDDARFLARRDGVDPCQLLAMMTINAARAIGLPTQAATLKPGSTPLGLISLPLSGKEDPIADVFFGSGDPCFLWLAKSSGFAGSAGDFISE